jgi:S-adenosylmethionine uptake transporter
MFGYVFAVAATRTGDLSFVAPFRYTSLVVALVLGAAVFGTFPDGLTLAGAAIVVGTGLFTLYRERALRRAAAAASAAAHP